jgi:hypothetical protein
METNTQTQGFVIPHPLMFALTQGNRWAWLFFDDVNYFEPIFPAQILDCLTLK